MFVVSVLGLKATTYFCICNLEKSVLDPLKIGQRVCWDKMPTLTLLTCLNLTRKSVLSGGKYLMTVGRLEAAGNLIVRHSLLCSSNYLTVVQ